MNAYQNFFDLPVTKYTVQLFFSPLDSLQHPEQIASGVLIEVNSKYFLATCKHVFNSIKIEDVVILTVAGLAVRLPDDVVYIKESDDSIDIALVKFDHGRIRALKERYSFLCDENIDLEHFFKEDLYYVFFGFINKQTSLNKTVFSVDPFAYLTVSRKYKKIERLGFNYKNNVTLEYNRRKQSFIDSNAKEMGPKDLKGLSGEGIWLSTKDKFAPYHYRYILVGILIEERTERGFVIGSKIGLIKNYIE